MNTVTLPLLSLANVQGGKPVAALIGSFILITFLLFANTVGEPSLGIGTPECVRQPTGGGGGIMCTELNPVLF